MPDVSVNNKQHLFIKSLLIGCMVFFAVSCQNENEPQLVEHKPDYLDYGVGRVNELKVASGDEAAIEYIDSLRSVYFDRSLLDKYYIYYMYADTYDRMRKLDKATKYSDTILNLLHNNPRENFWFNSYIWAYYFKAELERKKKNIDAAYEYYYKALSLAEEYNDKCAIGYYYQRIAHIVFSIEQYEDAVIYFKEAYNRSKDCRKDFGSFLSIQQTVNNVGLSYERMGMLDSAVYYYQEALDVINKAYEAYPDDTHWLLDVSTAVVKGNLGGVYLKIGKLDSAEVLLKESIAVNEDPKYDPWDAQYTRVKLAELYLKADKDALAKETLDHVARVNDTLNIYKVYVRWNRVMWLYWEKTGSLENAYKYLKNYKFSEDSLRSNQINISLSDVDNRVKNIGNEYRMSVLQQTADSRKIYLIAMGIIAVFAGVIIFLIIQNLRRSKKHVKELKSANRHVQEQSEKLKKAMSKLEAATGEKDRILKAVSHDMRSPINSSLALIEILQAQLTDLNEEEQEYFNLMKKSNENALHLTQDLLEAATLNKDKLQKELADITLVVGERIKLLQYKAAEKNQTIQFVAPKNHISAHVNTDKILRVLGNLVNNAIKFSPVDSIINVKLSSESKYFVLEVKDQGIGIPKEIQDKVFDLFSEAKRFGTSGEQPFGLGLSISKQIVEAHDGEVWFESEDCEGTTFYVRVPYS